MTAPDALVRIVDDDRSFASALARLLRASGFTVKTFLSAAELLAELEPDVPGCIVADLKMPGVDGLQLQEKLARIANPLPIVFLSGHGKVPDVVCAMRRGADDFLTKTAPKEDLLGAVRRALAHDAADRGSRAQHDELSACFATLTVREREVLVLVLSGRLNKQIAGQLGIHERTVKLHRTNFMGKLGVRSVAELTRLCHEAGILPSDAPPSL